MSEKIDLSPSSIVDKMLFNDSFSHWLGIEISSISEAKCEAKLITRKEMLNGFGILHGGITYSLADSILAFSANSLGFVSVSIDTQISHIKPVKENEVIRAKSTPIKINNTTAFFNIEIFNSKNEIIAHFKGTVYRTKQKWTENTL